MLIYALKIEIQDSSFQLVFSYAKILVIISLLQMCRLFLPKNLNLVFSIQKLFPWALAEIILGGRGGFQGEGTDLKALAARL